MLTLRLLVRYTLVACLLMFAIVLATPTSAPAKIYMVNGQDGAEGDPGDGLDYFGGGGHSGSPEQEILSSLRDITIIVYPTMFGCLKSLTLIYPGEVRNLNIHELNETDIRCEETGGLP